MNELSEITPPPPSPPSEAAPDLLEQYGCGPIRFSGHHDALYERHLLFDDVTDPSAAGGRERFEAPQGRSGMYCLNVGLRLSEPMIGQIRSGSIIYRWSF